MNRMQRWQEECWKRQAAAANKCYRLPHTRLDALGRLFEIMERKRRVLTDMPFSVWLTKDDKFGKIKETLAWKGVCMMFCKNCGKELMDGNAYCDNCGMAAGQGCNYCDQCGASHLPGAAVCTTCGKTLNPAAQNGVVYSAAPQEKPAGSRALSIVS